MSIEEAAEGLQVPELSNVWKHLTDHPVLSDVAKLHRGIEWNEPLTEDGEETGNRAKFVKHSPAKGFRRGVAPRTKFNVFELPEMAFLSLLPEHKRTNAYKLPWEKPKAILNKSTRSRGRWRIAAFADSEGVTCYQTFTAVWPKTDAVDEWILSAVLNSPVANAFVATREGKIDNKKETLGGIPFPIFSPDQAGRLRGLIRDYQRLTETGTFTRAAETNMEEAERILKSIDAAVLDGYHLPPRVEHELLDFFRGEDRRTPFTFSPYLPQDEDVYFSLSERLSPSFQEATAGALLKRMAMS